MNLIFRLVGGKNDGQSVGLPTPGRICPSHIAFDEEPRWENGEGHILADLESIDEA